jgi:hypothetical protein
MESVLELYSDLLNRLEQMTAKFLKAQFSSIQELWQFELDLVKYQNEMKKGIADRRKAQKEINTKISTVASTKLGDWKTQLQQFQSELKDADEYIKVYSHVYQLSKTLGDALAWLLLRNELRPLTHISREPVSDGHGIPEGHGLQGILAIAESLSNAGAGFPILHDITNCLRVGDITFYAPSNNPVTIEVKTHLIGSDSTRLSLEVETHYINHDLNDAKRWNDIVAGIPKDLFLLSTEKADSQINNQSQRLLDERLQRQIERMRRAKIWQLVQPNQPFKLGEREQGVKIFIEADKDFHNWNLVHELVDLAKVDGFAARVVDDSFVYYAVYRSSPISYPWTRGTVDSSIFADLPQLMISSSFLFPDPEKNRLWVPTRHGDYPLLMPFFLYPLSFDIIMDMMWGRLAVGVTVNLGKLIKALQEVGFDARLPKDEEEFKRLFLPVSVEVKLANNKPARANLHNLHYFGLQIIYEFLSLEGFVQLVSRMAKAATANSQNIKLENEEEIN